mmetsp:Transcript_5148/g.10105  ORF Transcript_5148/g.10105 Transcript_5148/m.10105 type:complete len:88 (-) Transcript_5148:4-267(-)
MLDQYASDRTTVFVISDPSNTLTEVRNVGSSSCVDVDEAESEVVVSCVMMWGRMMLLVTNGFAPNALFDIKQGLSIGWELGVGRWEQ